MSMGCIKFENKGFTIGGYMETFLKQNEDQEIKQPLKPEIKDISEIELAGKLKKLLSQYGYDFDEKLFEGIMLGCGIKKKKILENNIMELQSLKEEKEQEILVFPRGNYWFEKYKKWFAFDDEFFNNIISSYEDDNLPKPFFDKNHKFEESFGDITGYRLSDEGLYFKFVLNKIGLEAIKNKEFRYISPSFGEVTDTNKNYHQWYMDAITLTNIPAFMGVLPTLQEQVKLENNKQQQGGNSMNFEYLKAKLKLDKNATDKAVEDCIMQLIDGGEIPSDIIASLNEKLAKLQEEYNKSQEMVTQSQAEKELIKSELEKIKIETKKKENELFLEDCIKKSIIPIDEASQKYWLEQLTSKEIETRAYLSSIKPVEKFSFQNSQMTVNQKLSQEDLEIMKATGYDASKIEDVKLYLESQGGLNG
jgi:phage I-like protein